MPLTEVAYTGRHLRSPLAVILLYEWVQALARFPGGLAKEAVLGIATNRMDRADGAVWGIRLDQGLGCWRTALREPFPFDQSEAKQADVTKAASPRLEASNPQHPTYWYSLGKK